MRRLQPSRFPRRKPTRVVLLRIYGALRRHFGHRGWWPGETPFEVMVGAVLTQNAAWTNVEKAIQNLKREGLLGLRPLLKLKAGKMARLIRPSGYFNVKTKRLKNFLRFLQDRYQGDIRKMRRIPAKRLREELLGVNGIGKETADSILLYALSKPTFVVDAYTRRVFSRHRYLSGREDYDSIRRMFETKLQGGVALYNDYHAQIVEVGKEYCRKRPACESCPLRPYL